MASRFNSFSRYEVGLRQLLERLGPQHPRYPEALACQQRLAENIAASQRFGDSESLQRERSEILQALDALSMAVLETPFDALCDPGPEPPATPGEAPAPTPYQIRSTVDIGRVKEGTVKGIEIVEVKGDVFIQQEPAKPRRPFQAPPLPPYFVPRPEAGELLKAALLTQDTRPGTLPVSAVHGLGGIGKSVLAAALAHDPAVQARFPNGVLWTTLGQQPDVLSLQASWVHALGDYDFPVSTPESTTNHLRGLLHDQACLLVIDDAWGPAHVTPFLVGGSRCHVLITTRRAYVGEETGATVYPLPVMAPAQSLALLSARQAGPLGRVEQQQALGLAEAVGHLPLALELAAARVAQGTTSWADLRQALEREIARLDALAGPSRRRKGTAKLEASFNLSLDALRAEDEEAWRAFAWLGILPEDAAISAPLSAILWEVEPGDAADLLELLWNDALLLRDTPVRVGERFWPGYRLHDLAHDMARHLLTAGPPRGLGLDLETARQKSVKHLCDAMTTEKKASARRSIALWLIRLNWLKYVQDVSPEELLGLLDRVRGHIDLPHHRSSLVESITSMLSPGTLDLSERQRAQLHAHRGALRAQLGLLEEAEQDFQKAEQSIRRLIDAGDSLPQDQQAYARSYLGLANIATIRAMDPQKDKADREKQLLEATVLYAEALKEAQRYSKHQPDPELEAGIHCELGITWVRLGAWKKGREQYHQALKVLARSILDQPEEAERYFKQPLRILERRKADVDLAAMANCYALAQARASIMHWEQARRPGSPPLLEYAAAYKLARKTIVLLERYLGPSEALVASHIDAGDYLLALYTCLGQQIPKLRTKACQNWQMAQDMAGRMGDPRLEQEAYNRLVQYCAPIED